MRQIVTHKDPDGDALFAAWLAERFLFPGEETTVSFVARGPLPEDRWNADCVVDVGGVHDPGQRVFDHKPPAFADRNANCASSLLFTYLRTRTANVELLATFIAVVHEGDSNPPRRGSEALQASRRDGFHARVREARSTTGTDLERYQSVRLWLDALYTALTENPVGGS